MTNKREQSPTLWSEMTKVPTFSPLTENKKADVCIIGGGITGLTCAYLLSKEVDVILIDDGELCSGETSRTTAHLTYALDDHYNHLEKYFGIDGSRLAAESHKAAVDFIEKTSKSENIDCHFKHVDAYLFNPPNQSFENLQHELLAAHRAGLKDVEKVARAPFKTFDTGPCLRFPNQAQFFPLKYLNGIIQATIRQGGKIFTHTHMKEIEDKKGEKIIHTDRGYTINAHHAIIATNSAVDNRFFPHLKLASYRTYVITAKVPRGYVEPGLYYDSPDPYHYIRVVEDGDFDLLVVGGEDHRVGEYHHPAKKFDLIEKWTRKRFPEFGKIEQHWSGQILEPMDGLAYIGRSKESPTTYISTGDSGNGLTHGTIGGILLTDLILGRKNPWEKLYDPHRFTLKATKEFVEENINTIGQYRDWLTTGDISTIDEIDNNSGATIWSDGKKKAIYKDEHGKIHCLSAVCPHLKGVVRWNDLEKTWDCPCHGSRFTATGKVINGPANANLSVEDPPK